MLANQLRQFFDYVARKRVAENCDVKSPISDRSYGLLTRLWSLHAKSVTAEHFCSVQSQLAQTTNQQNTISRCPPFYGPIL